MPARALRSLVAVLLAATSCGLAGDDRGPYRIDATHAACFRPRGPSCAGMIAAAFDQARISILAEVYQFTEPTIGEALSRAQSRGVAVRLIVDRTTAGKSHIEQADLIHAVKVDCTVRIHHDKVAIIDARTVITGSYNWSVNAERHNDENVLLADNPVLAAAYT